MSFFFFFSFLFSPLFLLFLSLLAFSYSTNKSYRLFFSLLNCVALYCILLPLSFRHLFVMSYVTYVKNMIRGAHYFCSGSILCCTKRRIAGSESEQVPSGSTLYYDPDIGGPARAANGAQFIRYGVWSF